MLKDAPEIRAHHLLTAKSRVHPCHISVTRPGLKGECPDLFNRVLTTKLKQRAEKKLLQEAQEQEIASALSLRRHFFSSSSPSLLNNSTRQKRA